MGEEWWSSVLKGSCVGNTYFEPKYTMVAGDQDGVEVKSMIDLVLRKRDILHFVQDEEWDKTSQITMLYCVKSGWGHGLRGE